MREHGYPELRPLLCIGGVDMRSQLEVVKKGVHIVVSTTWEVEGHACQMKRQKGTWEALGGLLENHKIDDAVLEGNL
ncbi:unnamed protein product [Ilex paraguariensis]|uniref:Uncharacterized protein n=1 Tax=Ilex paraguariensis TaxID=185542 RepID=A0ABC8RZI1_9AQUA